LSYHYTKELDKLIKGLEKASKSHAAQVKVLEKIVAQTRRDPKVGTGKKPKGSGRRLYTDENPKDTVSIKYATIQDAKDTVAKVKKTRKPFARLIQILTVGEQRSKYGGKPRQAEIFRRGKDAIRKKHGRIK
jgi:hypothetical protein